MSHRTQRELARRFAVEDWRESLDARPAEPKKTLWQKFVEWFKSVGPTARGGNDKPRGI